MRRNILRVGIDFGTTNSSIAYFDGSKLVRIQVDPFNDNPYILPSLLYIDRNHKAVVGAEAGTEYLSRETGRPVRWEKRYVGEIEVVASSPGSGLIRYIQDLHALIDTAANGRLLQSVKTALRDDNYQGTRIFNRFYTIDELIAVILRSLKLNAEAQVHAECNAVVLGRPVKFSDDPKVNKRAEEIYVRAAHFAGFSDITFQQEPVGAAYLYHNSTSNRELALVFDFGGGTLDLTVAELGGSIEPKILSTRGVLVGGDDLDRRIMQSLLKYFGAGTKYGDGQLFPHNLLDFLANWQTMPDLSRPQYWREIQKIKKTTDNSKAINALETLITKNLGFKLFKEIERTKKRLSTEPEVTLEFVYGDIEIHEKITREQFEHMISHEIKLVDQGIRQVVADAGLRPNQIDVVLRTGGTSAVPAFTRLLAKRFGENKLREMDLFTSVVGGLAIVAHEDSGVKSPFVARYPRPDALVCNVHVSSGKPYEVYEMRMGSKCYIDRPATITRIPLALSGLPAIRTAQLDKYSETNDFLHFQLNELTRVYVVYEATTKSIPEWLRAFSVERMQVEVDQEGTLRLFQVYSKDFHPGTVVLGGNHAPGSNKYAYMNYFVVLKPLDDV